MRLREPSCAWIIPTLLLMVGCTVGPDYVPPEIDMPDAWHEQATEGMADGSADLRSWWTLLDDPQLNALIERAGRQNLDLRVAFARINEARAQRGVAFGQYLPDVDGVGFYQRSRASDNGIAPISDGGTSQDQENLHNAGFDATWEIDLFGRISRSVESADASLQASVEDYRDVLVLLYAEVAIAYIDVRTLQARLIARRQNVETQRQTLELTRNRFDAEIAPELDVSQAERNLASTESDIPVLETALYQTMNRLAVLLGQHPGTLHEELVEYQAIPEVPEATLVGLPANLLRQRPDIRRAERQLAAQTAQIGVATADLYPRFSLSGTFALEATNFASTFDGDSKTYSFGPAFRWNLFDGDRVRSRIDVEDARTQQVLAIYENTVLLGLEDVENAMIAYKQERLRYLSLQRSVSAAERSVELVDTLYRNGLSNFQNVLDAQRALASEQDRLADSDGQITKNLVRLYTALGGGWEVKEETSADSTGDSASAPN